MMLFSLTIRVALLTITIASLISKILYSYESDKNRPAGIALAFFDNIECVFAL